ncbi:MAG: universal stress protein [Crenarchaeota archaeon]|nr:universal stress protein [Thermoproteota archaeon]
MSQERAILVAYDGSEIARRAVSWAIQLAKALGAKLYVLYVVNVPPEVRAFLTAGTILNEALKSGMKVLEQIKPDLDKEGVRYDLVVEIGDPGEKIVEFADKINADLIVMGHRGLSGIKKLLVGSVCDKVIKCSNRPVLVVK